MKCAHCQVDFHAEFRAQKIDFINAPSLPTPETAEESCFAYAETIVCSKCKGAHVILSFRKYSEYGLYKSISSVQVMPRGGKFSPAPNEVPSNIAQDYAEANEVLPISPKASAALSRRCLQAILSSGGYSGRDLNKQIDAVLQESDSSKALPLAIRENIDAIRNFGNFSAHPITDQTTLQIVDVEEGEAEWCLEILQDLFEHYYVAPAKAASRRAALSAKLSGSGKPAMKT